MIGSCWRISGLFKLTSVQHFIYNRLSSPLARIPGPAISKWTDLVYIYYWFAGKAPNYVHRLHETYGKNLQWHLLLLKIGNIEY